jgi:hypothetical protein
MEKAYCAFVSRSFDHLTMCLQNLLYVWDVLGVRRNPVDVFREVATDSDMTGVGGQVRGNNVRGREE